MKKYNRALLLRISQLLPSKPSFLPKVQTFIIYVRENGTKLTYSLLFSGPHLFPDLTGRQGKERGRGHDRRNSARFFDALGHLCTSENNFSHDTASIEHLGQLK